MSLQSFLPAGEARTEGHRGRRRGSPEPCRLYQRSASGPPASRGTWPPLRARAREARAGSGQAGVEVAGSDRLRRKIKSGSRFLGMYVYCINQHLKSLFCIHLVALYMETKNCSQDYLLLPLREFFPEVA